MKSFRKRTSRFVLDAWDEPKRSTSIACPGIDSEEHLARVLNALGAETRRQAAILSNEDQPSTQQGPSEPCLNRRVQLVKKRSHSLCESNPFRQKLDMTQPSPDIEVAVSYQLHEYQQILSDYVATDLAQGGRLDTTRLWNWPFVKHLTFKILVPLVFRWKKSRVGDCVFAFNASGLSRTSKGRTASRTWAQINQVHHLSTAYLIELNEGGAMPVPYRCFTDAQRVTLDDLIEHVEAEEWRMLAEHARA